MRAREPVVAGVVLLMLGIIFVPLPSFVLDAGLVVGFTGSALLLVRALLIKDVLEFAAFPGLLLLLTGWRLALNIATTRIILTRAPVEGTECAGHVIQSFGQLVAGNEIVVGGVIFSLITIVNFVVITRGANRISEVSARFALDSLPGRQMVSGDGQTGAMRRERFQQEASFFGAMDGAMKFLRGDAVASVAITVVNVVGGLLMGTLRHGMAVSEALSTYTILTIGDGLASQVPAVLTSVGAAFAVSRPLGSGSLGARMMETALDRETLRTVALILLVAAACTLGSPSTVTLQLAGAGIVLMAFSRAPAPSEGRIELGLGWIGVAKDVETGIGKLRAELCQTHGRLVPPIRILSSASLGARRYRIYLEGHLAAEGEGPGTSAEPVCLALRRAILASGRAEPRWTDLPQGTNSK